MAKTGKESDEKEAKERKRKSLPPGFATLYKRHGGTASGSGGGLVGW